MSPRWGGGANRLSFRYVLFGVILAAAMAPQRAVAQDVFNYLDPPVEVTPGPEDTWTNVDVSGTVPAGATGVILHIVSEAGDDRNVGLRKPGSTDNRTELMYPETHIWAMAGLDGSGVFQAYLENTSDVHLLLVGYTMAGATFFTNAVDKSLSSTNTWVDIDISADTGADTAIGVIVEIDGAWEKNWGLRMNGSTDTRVMHGRHTWAIIGVDGSEKFEGYVTSTSADFFVIGYITDGATFLANAVDKTPSVKDSWEDIDLSSDTGADTAGGAFFQVIGNDNGEVGLRKKGAAEDEQWRVRDYCWGIVQVDADEVLQGIIDRDDGDNEFFLVGYSHQTAAPSIADLLLVVGDPANLTTQETARKTQFETWNYAVTLIDESDTQANYDTAVAANDVAYVPEEVASSNLSSKLVSASIGVIVEESECYDEFGLTATSVTMEIETDITILDYDHYITKPFVAGNLAICSLQDMNKVTSSVARGGQVLADWPLGGHALIAIDADARLIDGTKAIGRRVFLPIGGDSFDWNALTADGLTIVQRSLEWGWGLMAHWKLDETAGAIAVDSIGGYDATLTSMDPGTDWMDGRIDGGLDFDGINDRAITAGAFTPPAQGTVLFWMKTPGAPAAQGQIFGLDNAWEVRHVTLGTPDGIPYGLVFDLGISGVNTQFVTTTTLDAANLWYFVAATYDTADGSYAVYLDGELHKSGTAALTMPTGNQFTIGARTGSSNYFTGEVDDLRISNRPMGADEIAALYAQSGVRAVRWQETAPF